MSVGAKKTGLVAVATLAFLGLVFKAVLKLGIEIIVIVLGILAEALPLLGLELLVALDR